MFLYGNQKYIIINDIVVPYFYKSLIISALYLPCIQPKSEAV
jgi:hypothetical protein